MNKLLSLKYVIMCFAVTGAFMFQSCDNDEDYDIVGSTENTVYINTQTWSPIDAPKNSFKFNVLNTPVGSIISDVSSVEIKFAVQCTHAASKDVTVNFEIDNSLVTDGYSELPDDITYVMDKTSLTIAKGSFSSDDSITVSIDTDDLNKLEVGSFMLPIKISTVENAEVSSSLCATYLIVKTSYTNCIDQATSISGTAVTDKSAWSASVDGVDQGTYLWDESSSTYYYGDMFTLEVDLGSVYENITGLQMSFYRWYYAMASANIYTSSTTTDEYELQGSPTFPSYSSTQYVSFYSTVSARYIKVEITAPSYSSYYGTAITEFGIYK